jgi:hypothetical protein
MFKKLTARIYSRNPTTLVDQLDEEWIISERADCQVFLRALAWNNV